MGSCMTLLLVSINAQIAQKRALSGRPPSLIQLFDGGLVENCNLFAFLVLLFSCMILYFFSCYGFFFLEINKELVQVERTFTGLYDAPGVRNKFNIYYSREVARCGISSPNKDGINPQYYSYIK